MGELTGLKADLAQIVRLALAEQAWRAAAQDELAFAAGPPARRWSSASTGSLAALINEIFL
ncbi:hypothetical protein [Xylella fastidiosa]|uniref:hypothetical protein n=1 Tax=Xylella fastidiosa TaxID=2371 RepID=UPI0004226284|nr:hypothetical protein [Xylella fastidiosa]MDC7971265.1 hypothetical protein [Xylella fastidiosa subsp. multiplex]UIT47269.1 hypothetical protein LZ754_08855 [Xylella fastidiosa subsp. multiplex]WDF06086.1 hypothetical protein PT012_06185 [Xylella fastidiosa subsp. multiplex]WDF06492.1 hypothetical protein PT012_08490 [Xylella fastidiosa subsp. multiplex]